MSTEIPDTGRNDSRPAQEGAIYVPADTGLSRWFSGDLYTLKVGATDTNGSVGVIDAVVPSGAGPEPHVHPNTDECFYVISGELEFLGGDQILIARAGDFLFVPRGTPHRYKNIGLHPARYLGMYTPGGLERIFAEGGDVPQVGVQSPPWGRERFEALLPLMRKYDTNNA